MDALQWLFDLVFPTRDSERIVRRASPDDLHALVSLTAVPIENGSVTGLLSYQNPLIKACIKEAKYHANETAQGLLAEVLREYLRALTTEETALSSATILIPIPLSKQRKRERGYNQVTGVCAKAVPEGEEITIDESVLIRIRDTVPQTTLHRMERLENMTGAFSAQHVQPSATYVVVDDVVTTGATLTSAMTTLKESGAHHVIGIALAH